jgi:hypothetical protein
VLYVLTSTRPERVIEKEIRFLPRVRRMIVIL